MISSIYSYKKRISKINYTMTINEKNERLKDIKTENLIWVIYIGIIILSWYANSKEKHFVLYEDNKSKKEYQKLMILIFTILVIAYYYFAKDSLEDYQKLTPFDNKKKRNLTTASLIASLFILVSGLILLGIAIEDDDTDIEIAFN
jgi:multisubunit Na+/H+ antiporter MnhB subunit